MTHESPIEVAAQCKREMEKAGIIMEAPSGAGQIQVWLVPPSLLLDFLTAVEGNAMGWYCGRHGMTDIELTPGITQMQLYRLVAGEISRRMYEAGLESETRERTDSNPDFWNQFLVKR